METIEKLVVGLKKIKELAEKSKDPKIVSLANSLLIDASHLAIELADLKKKPAPAAGKN